LVARWLIPVDLALDVYAKLRLCCGVSVRALSRLGKVDIWKRSALFCFKIGNVVVIPVIARRELLEEVV
jgi:hypothetical protein